MKRSLFFGIIVSLLLFSACRSIKSTIQNIDNSAIKPAIKNNQFILKDYDTEGKYGYDMDYPINLGFESEKTSQKNITYFFNAISGPNGEKISFKKIDTCCPFPSKKSSIGAGTLEKYQISYEGIDKTIILYINVFEKGSVLCPKGFKINKQN